MVSASSDKPAAEWDRMAFKDELKRSVLLDINCQVDDTPVFTTADGFNAYLKHLNETILSDRSRTKPGPIWRPLARMLVVDKTLSVGLAILMVMKIPPIGGWLCTV